MKVLPITERQSEAKRLHNEGLTYEEVGARMGITRQGAHLLVNPEKHRVYQRLNSHKWRKVKEKS